MRNLRKPSFNLRFKLYWGDRYNVECGKIQKLNYQLDVVIRGSSHLLGRLLGPGVHILMSLVGVGNRRNHLFISFYGKFWAKRSILEVEYKIQLQEFIQRMFISGHNTHPCLAPDV